eukprot:41409-Pelagomonas_calceolata.AAC.1
MSERCGRVGWAAGKWGKRRHWALCGRGFVEAKPDGNGVSAVLYQELMEWRPRPRRLALRWRLRCLDHLFPNCCLSTRLAAAAAAVAAHMISGCLYGAHCSQVALDVRSLAQAAPLLCCCLRCC